MNAARKKLGRLGGRPDTIDDAMVERANAWIENEMWRADGDAVPTVEGLAKYLGLYRTYLYAAPELTDTIEMIQREQARHVLSKGLTGEFNSGIAKLLLSSKHGYVEKSEQAVDVTSKGESLSASTDLDAYNAFMLEQSKTKE